MNKDLNGAISTAVNTSYTEGTSEDKVPYFHNIFITNWYKAAKANSRAIKYKELLANLQYSILRVSFVLNNAPLINWKLNIYSHIPLFLCYKEVIVYNDIHTPQMN